MSEPRYTALVTGGSAGIGADICQRMLAEGWHVVSLARRAPEWQHPNLTAINVDLLDAAATAQAARDVAARFAISHFIHNAGVIWPHLLQDATIDELQGLTQIHLGSALTLMQAVLPNMEQAGFGRVVLMSSRGALGLATRTNYSATKAGMIGMARTWALELAPHGVTVNVVSPGPIGDTEMFESVMSPESERARALAKSIPVGRLGRSADVARAVDFFCDEAADFVTGQTLLVCGGASIGALSM